MEIVNRYLKLTNRIGIIVCIITYVIAFSAFDKSAVVDCYDDYEFYVQYLILAMSITGLITTFFMVGYILVDRCKCGVSPYLLYK